MIRFTHVVIACLAGLCSASAAMEEKKQQVHDFTQHWANGGPLQWLRQLQATPRTVFYVSHAPERWIGETDLPNLVAALDCTAPAGIVCYLASAHAVHEDVQSTVGLEAALLIDAFRRDGPYPGNCSDLHSVDVTELR